MEDREREEQQDTRPQAVMRQLNHLIRFAAEAAASSPKNQLVQRVGGQVSRLLAAGRVFAPRPISESLGKIQDVVERFLHTGARDATEAPSTIDIEPEAVHLREPVNAPVEPPRREAKTKAKAEKKPKEKVVGASKPPKTNSKTNKTPPKKKAGKSKKAAEGK